MQRFERQNLILDIIANEDVSTQQDLCKRLRDKGHDVTQATVSRDIREMNIVKTQKPDGKQKYVISSASSRGPVSDRFIRIFKSTILKMYSSENIIVAKTLSGCGPAAGEAIDSLYIDHVIGSVAGDNTVMIIADSRDNVPHIMKMLDDILK